MERVYVNLLQLLLLTIAVTSGEATMCHQCSTATEPKCNDPFEKNDVPATECTLESLHKLGVKIGNAVESLGSKLGLDIPSGGSKIDVHWSCMKIDYTTSSGDKHVIRSCQPPKSDSYDPCTLKDSNDKQSFCGLCEGDGCNGAGRLGGVSALFYLLLPCLIALKAVAA